MGRPFSQEIKAIEDTYAFSEYIDSTKLEKYILEHMGRLSTWKLQKLCFYAQAWTLAWDGEELFREDFQAWSNGPVCPELFRVHKGKFSVEADDIPWGNPTNLNENQTENIDIVIRDYGDMEPYELREQTHGEDPWKKARGNLPDGASSNALITKESIGEYYGSL